jgi:hypothetical protein
MTSGAVGRLLPSVAGLLVALSGVIAAATPANAQMDLCGSVVDFATASGSGICTGPVLAATATVRSVVVLTLDEVFGAPAAGLMVNFGSVDAHCAGIPATGASCSPDAGGTSAVWYGPIRFTVRMGGARGASGPVTARLTGERAVAGTMPNNRLLDGPAGAVPSAPYKNSTIDLRTGIPNGRTIVNRSIGVRVNVHDAPGAWSTSLVYNVVME